jgi:ABC-type dipeptide/oligopeptide/nickel transport system permease subunit
LHLLGTDHPGRDVPSRILIGTDVDDREFRPRIGDGVSVVLGIVYYFGGKVDMVTQRLVDA